MKQYLIATPYDVSVQSFQFSSYVEFTEKSSAIANEFGGPIEEFFIEFGDGFDEELFDECQISSENLEQWFYIDTLDASEKIALYFLINCAGSDLDSALQNLGDANIFEGDYLDAATDLFDEIYLHEIPNHLQNYIDYESFARDLKYGGDSIEFEYAGNTYTCTNANSF